MGETAEKLGFKRCANGFLDVFIHRCPNSRCINYNWTFLYVSQTSVKVKYRAQVWENIGRGSGDGSWFQSSYIILYGFIQQILERGLCW